MGLFITLLVLYIIAEVNRPQPVDWTVTLSKADKNPYGGYVLFNRLKDLFPYANIQSYRKPAYNQLNNSFQENTAYFLLGESLPASQNDVDELLNYVTSGNYLFISSTNFSKGLSDTLHLKTDMAFSALSSDSTYINFTDPAVKSKQDYTFKKMTLDEYFTKYDTAVTTVLGRTTRNRVNFIKMTVGDGAIFIHANPLVFSNYFMLANNNSSYTSTALSYIPKNVDNIYWDEYYKLGPDGATSPLRFFLSNDFLRWALRLSIFGMLLYVLFEMKRRQRIIPVIVPLRNTTVDFIKTIAGVYFQQKDNSSIALKKITYFLEFIRNTYFINTNHLNMEFIETLSRKSGVSKTETEGLVQLIYDAQNAKQVSDKYLLVLNNKIDQFYKQVQ